MVVHTCNPNTQEVEAGEVQGLPEVASDPAPSSKKKEKKRKVKPGGAFLCGCEPGL